MIIVPEEPDMMVLAALLVLALTLVIAVRGPGTSLPGSRSGADGSSASHRAQRIDASVSVWRLEIRAIVSTAVEGLFKPDHDRY
jgi:hypothetical protein